MEQHFDTNYLLSPIKWLWLSFGLVVVGLFLFMGLQPLFLEEPRRAFIAMELLDNNNLWVPTQLGQPYYNKPPFFNWLLVLSAFICGGFSEWAMRLPTVFSTIGIALLIYGMGKRYVNQRFGLQAGLLSITSAGIFFYFSTLAEIDLFYSLLTLSLFFTIFHFDQKNQHYTLFLMVYLLTSIGFLTKGLPSLVFTALSLLTYFIYTRRFFHLFYPKHILGILLFFILTGGYYYIYAQYADPWPFLERLWGESSKRTLAGNGLTALLLHLLTFPINTWVDLLPGGILIIFIFRKNLYHAIQEHPFIRFCFWMALINIAVYWLSPGSRQRYIYMIYPLLSILLLFAYHQEKDLQAWPHRFFNIFLLVLCGLLVVGSIGISFIPDFYFLSYRIPLSVLGAVAFLGLGYLFWRNKIPAIATLIITTALARIIFDLTILPQRDHDTDAQKARDTAIAIQQIVEEAPLYLYWPHQKTIINEFDISFITVYYLDYLREGVLRYEPQKFPRAYFIAKKADLQGEYDLIMEFSQGGHEFALIRWL